MSNIKQNINVAMINSSENLGQINSTTTLNPSFNPLNDPETFLNINPFKKEEQEPLASVGEILAELLKAFTPINFETEAYPKLEQLRKEAELLKARLQNPDDSSKNENKTDLDRYKKVGRKIQSLKINEKHFLILTIENVIKLAEMNKWGICRNGGFVYLYNGAYWVKLEKDTLQNFLGKAAEKMGVEKYSARYFQFQDKLLKQFFATAYLPTLDPPENTVLINLKNGTFEISPNGNHLRSFNREDFLTYQLPFEYHPDTRTPKFDAFINKVLPEKELQMILSEYLGSVFIRNKYLKLEKALLLYGTGANGKSVIYEIVNALLGAENVSSFSLESLTDKNGYYRAMIAGKLVNYASEINGKLEASFFKQLASGEPIEARLPFIPPFMITDYAKLIFNLNELPREVEHTHAFFRRLLILPFDVTIPEAEQDKELAKKIIETELTGVFNWVLQGLYRLLSNKNFTYCDASNHESEEYKKNSDSVKLFIDENNYMPSANYKILLKELYLNYRIYCGEDGYKPVNKLNFKRRLLGMKIVIEKLNTGYNVYLARADPSY